MSIPGEATFRQQFGEYRYLRQVMSELITLAMKRSASAFVEQVFGDPLKRMSISMNRPFSWAVRRRSEGHCFCSDKPSGAKSRMRMSRAWISVDRLTASSCMFRAGASEPGRGAIVICRPRLFLAALRSTPVSMTRSCGLRRAPGHFPVAPVTGETIRLAVSGLGEAPGKAVIAAAKGGAGIAFSLLFAGVHRGSTTPCVSLIA
jgi:hypothetical protein